MTPAPDARHQGTAAVALLTAAWIVAALVAALQWISAGMTIGAAQGPDGEARSAGLEHRGAAATTTLALVLVGGPVLIAVVALVGGRTGTGAFFLVLAAVFGMIALVAGFGGDRTSPSAPPSASPSPSICQERSGGDTECPGG